MDVCVETITQVCAQLQVFSESSSYLLLAVLSITIFDIKRYLDSLSLPIASLQAAQRSVSIKYISLYMMH